jgi:uncharacterized protein with PIN domain
MTFLSRRSKQVHAPATNRCWDCNGEKKGMSREKKENEIKEKAKQSPD